MRKRYLQFSIASLLSIVTVAAFLSFWLAKTSNSAREQVAAVEEVEEGEGIVHFKSKIPAPEWLRKAVGEDYFRSVITVDFATEGGRKRGSHEPKATDENLKYLESLTDLEILELGNSEEITDLGLVHLTQLKNLSTLYLYQTGIRGPGLVHISRLPKLTSISLSRSELHDSGLQHLGNMSRLTWARLDHTKVTDAGIPDLVRAVALETVDLRNTAITDVGLKQLEQLNRLKSLNVAGTHVTVDGVGRFKQAMPNCEVTATFGLGEEPSEELLFPASDQPTAIEINKKLKELKIDGEVEADASKPGSPIVTLRLFGCKLSDKVVLSLIEEMPELKVLNIRQGLVGDELLAGIGGKPICYLSLEGTRVTDAGMQHLSQLPALNELILRETDVTDEGLVHLYGLSNLKHVALEDSRTTWRGITKLREVLPNW